MNMETFEQWFTLDYVLSLLEHYRSFGVFPGIAATLLESFFPILPMVVFVMANAAAFGLWKGFFISWLGASLGSLIVFWLTRRIGRQRFFHFVRRHQKVRRFMHWIERHGFGPLFLLYCFPFTPSALINIVAGLSGISRQQFVLAVLLGKMVMIFMISFIGYDIVALVRQPLRTAGIALVVLLLWYAGKRVEARFSLTEKQHGEGGGE
ncbi:MULTISPECIES: TVP38/TMEM64 family protein [Geobacillus]|jgi:uncharacterized membrane protein YdjX (TVP38/TMEM64 family)|uniref:TVP38/TMEM64 family membrane protein n=2 Tax=Geobacillus thermodenitrificans TaxID=33940 RepID=A4IKW4_GEOTN|nr:MULTISPECIES: TVP38/TMEM64 family protein [Geobacillus]ABO65968.1 Conserved hypothetical protein [Geobacillus thermodenitrificans NG80-2]ARP41701.1 putative protein YqeD [Geobacillus thermodenitrificans]ATO36922.1 hypothetical protein GTID1_06540 [Geobacillus thermodenitrificans]MEC5188880.1 putative membrane protein YdjX (TVP38/TMEM64 family) [Geobacillus thermodenitrificans]MED0664123.1 TVP38/TMEM64 family protein [Geobacillus thermodenitrificans]